MIDDPESTGTPWRVGPTRPADARETYKPEPWRTTRHLIINDIEANGPATVATLAKTIGRSESAVRNALSKMRRDGIVARGMLVKGKAQKPSQLWRLT